MMFFLHFGTFFGKLRLRLPFGGLSNTYTRARKIKLTERTIEQAVAVLIYAVALLIIAGIMYFVSGNSKPEVEDLLEPRRVAAEEKLNLCLGLKPTKNELSANPSDFYYDFKKIGCPEFLLYLDTCDTDCRKTAIRNIKRSFYSVNNKE